MLFLQHELIKPSDIIYNISQKKYSKKYFFYRTTNGNPKAIKSTLEDYVFIEFDQRKLQEIKSVSNDFIELQLPVSSTENVILQLFKTHLFDDNDFVKTFLSEKLVKVDTGIYYRGIVKGKPHTVVAMSFFDEETIGIASGLYESNLVTGK